MIKNVQPPVFLLTLLFSWCTVVTRQENAKALQHSQLAEEPGEFFKIPQDFEELDMDIKMVRAKKMNFSIQDVPLYTKLFYSYLYEEKIKKWYQVLAGYLASNAGKKSNKNKKFKGRP